MKNFFKKLSFVLALAMVLTSLYVPADASAAATNFVVTKHSGKSYSKSNPLYIYIGGFVQNLDYSINGKKSGVAGTWESSKPAVVDVDAKTGALTAKKLGSAVVTFTTKDGKTKVATAVKVRARAASAKFYVKGEDGTNTVIDSIDVEEGATAEVRVALPVNKKAKAAGATKSSYFVQETEVADTAIASVEQAGEGYMESRILTISGKTDGTTTLTITANSETKNPKYAKTAELTINVGNNLAAEQIGDNKIQVSGKGLTNVVADYAVKNGNQTINIKNVTLNEDGTATLEAVRKELAAGDYTLSFKGSDPIAFKVVKVVAASIVIDPENAILQTASTQAIAYYKVLDQFGNDVTAKKVGDLNVTSSVKNAVADKYGKITFTSEVGLIAGVSQISVVVVDKTSGVNVNKILPVTGAAQLTDIAYLGLYKEDNGKISKVETLTEGDDVSKIYLVYDGKDQYGMDANTAANATKLNVSVVSAVGLRDKRTGNNNVVTIKKVDNQDKIFVALDGTITGGGSASVFAVNINNGKTDSQNIEIAAAVKIDSFSVSAADAIYSGKADNELLFTAIDTKGNEVTDAKTIAKFIGSTEAGIQNSNGGKLYVKAQKDGSAKLYLNAPSKVDPSNKQSTAVTQYISLTFMTPTRKFSSVTLNAYADPTVVGIINIKSDATVATTVSGAAIELTKANFIYEDQYGNEIKLNDSENVKFTLPEKAQLDYTGSSESKLVVNSKVGQADSIAEDITVQVSTVTGGEFSFKVARAALKDVTNFKITEFANIQHVDADVKPEVTGDYNGITVKLATGEFNITAGGHTPAKADGKVVDATINVSINNLTGTPISQKYQYSDADAYAKAGSVKQGAPEIIDGEFKPADNFKDYVTVTDQYGDPYPTKPIVLLSGNFVDGEIQDNNTNKVTLKVTAQRNIHAVYTFGSVVVEADYTVNP